MKVLLITLIAYTGTATATVVKLPPKPDQCIITKEGKVCDYQ